MLEFKTIELSDRDWMEKCFKESDFRGCEYSFANLFIWRKVSKVLVAQIGGMLCITGKNPEGEWIFNYPAGNGNAKAVMDSLRKKAEEQGKICRFRGITKEQKAELEKIYGEEVEFNTDEGDWDYIYEVEKMQTLSGKKYHGKRNHIARFKDHENWSYEAITKDNLWECRQMNELWWEKTADSKGKSAREEQEAVEQCFQYFEKLSLEGGLLRLDGKVVAFTIGEPINSDTYGVHIEKAFSDIQGAYPMINQQFAIHNMSGFRYVNREEDVGDEGLRKAKHSYRPELLLEKYTMSFIS